MIPKLPVLWKTMADSFQTDLPLDQVINLAYVGVNLKPQRIISRNIGPGHVQSWMTPQGAAVLLPRNDKIKTLLENFYAPKDLDGLDKKEKTRLRILNGSQRGQAAQLAAAAVKWEGYKVVEALAAEDRDQAKTRIMALNGDMAGGQALAKLLNVPATAVEDGSGLEQTDPNKPVDYQIILGSDYDPCYR
jgi:hypothetical protein